jgi:hypothetical protein
VKYLLMIYNRSGLEGDTERLVQGHTELYQELASAGKVISSASLTDPPAASTVHIRDGGVPAVTDGPFLEAKEYLAGYYLVDVDTREEALRIAARIPCGAHGAVEVRPVNEEITRTVRGE